MTYTTLASVKTGLGISGTIQDTILNQLITDADRYINKMLDIISFDAGVVTEQIKYNPNAYSSRGYMMLYLQNFNVTLIQEINGVAYSGVLNTDYQIQNSRVLQIRNLHQYFVPTYFDYLTVKYTYGYDRTAPDKLPSDIELMARLLVIGLYNEKYPMGYTTSTNGDQPNMQGVSDYELGDESISWDGSIKTIGGFASWKSPEDRNQFMQLFMKYKKANVIQ